MPGYWSRCDPAVHCGEVLRSNPILTPNGVPPRLVSDAVAALTALHANPGLTPHGVAVLLDFGGGGTSITLANAGAGFEPLEETTRHPDFSGDLIDQALLNHVLEGIAHAGGVDPAGTAAVGSLSRLREACRAAKERLSAATVTELVAELPGYRSTVRVTRNELERLIAAPLAGVLATLENVLERNSVGWSNVSTVVTVGGGASIPLVTQRLSGHTRAPVMTTPQPALDAAVGGALVAAFGADADAQTGAAPAVVADAEAQTGMAPTMAGAVVPDIADVEPGSATFRALAWSQDDDAADEPLPYTGSATYDPYDPQDPYDTDVHGARPDVQYVPATGPVEQPRPRARFPQAVFAVVAALVVLALGGTAYALTSASERNDAAATRGQDAGADQRAPTAATAHVDRRSAAAGPDRHQ